MCFNWKNARKTFAGTAEGKCFPIPGMCLCKTPRCHHSLRIHAERWATF